MKYVPITNVPMKNKYEVFIDDELTLTTFDAFTAECEREMSWSDDVQIRITQVQK